MLLLLPAGCVGSAVGVRAPPPLVRVAGGVVCSLFPSWQTFPPPLVDSQPKRVTFYTSAGDFKVDVDRANSPAGVDRLLQLVNEGFFSGQLLYRVIPGFLIQFGVAADPEVMSQWDAQKLPDEPNRAPFRRGTLSFAGNGADSRSCHLFIALEPHGKRLGKASHETTLGWVDDNDLYVSHMNLSPMPVALWLSLHTDIRCSHPHGELLEKLRSLLLTHQVLEQIARNFEMTGYQDTGSLQGELVRRGNEAAIEYPGLDYIIRAEEEWML